MREKVGKRSACLGTLWERWSKHPIWLSCGSSELLHHLFCLSGTKQRNKKQVICKIFSFIYFSIDGKCFLGHKKTFKGSLQPNFFSHQ